MAKVWLDHAVDGNGAQLRLAQRDIAAMTGTDWFTVHMSLRSIWDEGENEPPGEESGGFLFLDLGGGE